MQINGSIPFHVARAYGVKPPSAAPPAVAPVTTTPASAPVSAPLSTPVSSAPDASRTLAAPAQGLVGGTVPGSVDFRSATPAAPTGAYQLYTRAADKIEAAVSVELGRTIDVRG